jgi:uncharacterized protein YecT (DUF1311 family)
MRHLSILLLAFLPLSAFAQVLAPCDGAGGTPDLNACVYSRFEAQDKTLNKVYKVVLDQLRSYEEPGRRSAADRLVMAQRNWVKFREQDCRAQEALVYPGTAHTVMFYNCMQERTIQRIKELKPESWNAY